MYIKLYALALPVFFAIDMLWLGVVAKGFYAQQLGHLMRPSVHWGAALLFYLLFIAGLIVFAITPAIEKGSFIHAVLLGAFFGFITYATYDLTNLATLKDWPLAVTVVDLIWGAVLAGTVSAATYLIAQKIGI